MWDYENMDVMFVTTLEMEHLGVGKIVKNLVLALKEEHEDGISMMIDTMMEK
jgi:hypothetical protein